jgi:hypothetical protein
MVKMRKKCVSENLNGRDHLEDLDVKGRKILKWIFKKQGEDMEWAQLAQDRVQWQAPMNTVMNLGVP